ncbi:pancreatic lipase-related protein 2-like [Diadema antillarum]|uniref:pancreatic lipase-related protein 2-like n=1 Tax=Diadema antillarum TaxID=105358 RepID=UPI003A8724A3
MVLFLLVLVFTLGHLAHAAEICYDGLGCFTDELECHRPAFPPQSLEEIDLHFYLYTRRNRYTPYELFRTDVDNIRNSNFDPQKRTKILTHGYLGNYEEQMYEDLKNAFLDREDVNFILLDWRDGAVGRYSVSMQNARVVGRQTASLIETFNVELGAYYKDFHVIGYSLGGHVAGYVGEIIPGLGRITGLDPAGPGFQYTDVKECRLDESDAMLVDVIHSGAKLTGTAIRLGHMDFYPNGGEQQPGCGVDVTSNCSHERSRQFLLESLTSTDCQFTSYPCDSWNRYRLGACTSCGEDGCPVMGIDAELTPMDGTFYLATNAQSPYCIN